MQIKIATTQAKIGRAMKKPGMAQRVSSKARQSKARRGGLLRSGYHGTGWTSVPGVSFWNPSTMTRLPGCSPSSITI